MSAPLPAGVSHLLAADDALIPGRWDVHITLCGLKVRAPSATAAEHDDLPSRDSFRYCPECVREAVDWNAEQTNGASESAR